MRPGLCGIRVAAHGKDLLRRHVAAQFRNPERKPPHLGGRWNNGPRREIEIEVLAGRQASAGLANEQARTRGRYQARIIDASRRAAMASRVGKASCATGPASILVVAAAVEMTKIPRVLANPANRLLGASRPQW